MKAGAAMSDTIVLPFPRQPDLAATMEIQVPALAWQPRGSGWERAYRVDGTLVDVTVTEDDRALRYHLSPVPGPSETRHLEQLPAQTAVWLAKASLNSTAKSSLLKSRSN